MDTVSENGGILPKKLPTHISAEELDSIINYITRNFYVLYHRFMRETEGYGILQRTEKIDGMNRIDWIKKEIVTNNINKSTDPISWLTVYASDNQTLFDEFTPIEELNIILDFIIFKLIVAFRTERTVTTAPNMNLMMKKQITEHSTATDTPDDIMPWNMMIGASKKRRKSRKHRRHKKSRKSRKHKKRNSKKRKSRKSYRRKRR